MNLDWYLRRLRRMTPAEVAGRVADRFHQTTLRFDAQSRQPSVVRITLFASPITQLPGHGAEGVIAAADRLLEGTWTALGVVRDDMAPVPDWFLDPVSGIRAPHDMFSFDIEHRDPSRVGSIKQIWELSRHHHLTVLAAAFAVTGREAYAELAAAHLRDWWQRNPLGKGPHWISGIELGIRMTSWVWTRRLLAGWGGVEDLFDLNPDFHRQLAWHQWYLARFPSRGSSANNHLLAEAAGQLIAAIAFPWFRQSAGWAAGAREVLERETVAQTFPSGLNRELATDYHGLAMELCLVAAAEADAAGEPLSEGFWETLRGMTDALAAMVDIRLHPPRQGDSDDGTALVVDPAQNRWASLLATGAALFGELDWWPALAESDLRTRLITWLAKPPPLPAGRPTGRPDLFADAGMILLRTPKDESPEIWCRLDAGPHGFLSIAAHAHADALSVEVRHDGVEVLADPGTYTYHAEPELRAYFRSTRAHNTLELDGVDQSVSGGPFLWTRQARSRLESTGYAPGRAVTASHDGYSRLEPGRIHRRTVELTGQGRLVIEDEMGGGQGTVRLSFHLGPEVDARLRGNIAELTWPGGSAVMNLPEELFWSSTRGGTEPIDGWYSPRFGERLPSISLAGTGTVAAGMRLRTEMDFTPTALAVAAAGGTGEAGAP